MLLLPKVLSCPHPPNQKKKNPKLYTTRKSNTMIHPRPVNTALYCLNTALFKSVIVIFKST